jgi:hypothetical protein
LDSWRGTLERGEGIVDGEIGARAAANPTCSEEQQDSGNDLRTSQRRLAVKAEQIVGCVVVVAV